MKTLIVATDFSEEAENALEYAGASAKEIGAKVIIFNSFSIPIHTANSILPATAIDNLAAQNKLLLKERASRLSVKYCIEVGFESGLLVEVSDELNRLFAKYDGSIVVMGMAPSSIAQDLFGNTTTSAIMKLAFPVLSIPPGAAFKKVKKILFACDVMRGVQKEILDRIKNIATAMNAEIEIFHVQDKVKQLRENDDQQDETDKIEEALAGVTYYYKDVSSGAVVREIENEIKNFNADLLIMIPQKYGFWESLVHRSKTRIMASNCNIPLLSIPL